MILSRLTFSFVIVVLPQAVLAAGDAKEDAIKKERKLYEGTWQVVSIEFNGIPFSEDQAKEFTIINDADGKWSIVQSGKVVASGTSELDPTAEIRTVDLKQTEGGGAGQTLLGIYEIKDDTRKVCFASPGQARPTEFTSASGSQRILAVMKRAKKK